jgi:hypothetical protein
VALCVCVGVALIAAADAQKKFHEDNVAFGASAVAALMDAAGLEAKAKEYQLKDGNKLKELLM